MMSSPRGWVRVLSPLNSSSIVAGSLIVVRSTKDDTQRGIVLSIDGIEWLALENPRRVLQFPLPSSLQPGWHMLRVSAEDDASPTATEEAACVWFSITRPSTTVAVETRAIEVVHPLTGAWFSRSSAMCPAAAHLKAPPGGAWVPCSFAIRVHFANAGEVSSDTSVQVLVQKQRVWHGVVRKDTVQIPISLKEVGWHTVSVDGGARGRAEVHVEVLDAAEATARQRDVRVWCAFYPKV